MAGSTHVSPTAEAATTTAVREPVYSPGLETWRRFRRHRLAVASMFVLALMVLAIALGPLLWPVAINEIDFTARLESPSWRHPLGTDDLGQDLLARILYGGRISLAVGLAAMLVAVLVGIIIGAIAGISRGSVDAALMWLTDLFLSLPQLPLLLLVIYLFRDSLKGVLGPEGGVFVLIVVVIQTIVLVVLTLLVVSLLKSHAAILRRLHEAGFGDPADEPEGSPREGIEMDDADLRTVPGVQGLRDGTGGPLVDVSGTTPKGSSVAIGIEGARHATLLAFLSSSCTTCATFWQAFAEDPLLPGGARLVIVTQGAAHESPSKVAELAPAGATTVMSDEAWDSYTVPGSPYFVLAGPGGTLLGEGSALAWPQVEQLIERALSDRGAGASFAPSGAQGREKGARRWKDRERDTDEELLAAGIRPGDPSLQHQPMIDREGESDGTR